jgi:hypothetical protein
MREFPLPEDRVFKYDRIGTRPALLEADFTQRLERLVDVLVVIVL